MDQFTTECLPNGSGQCDGWHAEGHFKHQLCGCPCHSDDAPVFRDLDHVLAWHNEFHFTEET